MRGGGGPPPRPPPPPPPPPPHTPHPPPPPPPSTPCRTPATADPQPIRPAPAVGSGKTLQLPRSVEHHQRSLRRPTGADPRRHSHPKRVGRADDYLAGLTVTTRCPRDGDREVRRPLRLGVCGNQQLGDVAVDRIGFARRQQPLSRR